MKKYMDQNKNKTNYWQNIFKIFESRQKTVFFVFFIL